MSSWPTYPQGPSPYAPGQGWYRVSGPAKALRILLIIVMAALALLMIAYAVRQGVHNDYDAGRSDLDSLDRADNFVGFAASLTGGLTIAIFVLTVIWQWRLAKNHERLGRPGTTFGPGWAIGGWFIPIANFVLPFLQFRELWKGSDPAAPRHSYDWRNAKVSPILWLWWGFFVAAYIVELSTSYELVVGTVSTIDTKSTGGSIAASGCRIVAALFFFIVIGQLTQRQERAIASAMAATPAPTAWGGQPGGPWASQATTWPAVTPAGGSAPVPPPADLAPGWKPDPTGRGSYRYWDGSRWTEHAAIDGRTFSSPLA